MNTTVKKLLVMLTALVLFTGSIGSFAGVNAAETKKAQTTSSQETGSGSNTRKAKSAADIIIESTGKAKVRLSLSAVDRIWESSLKSIKFMCKDIKDSKLGVNKKNTVKNTNSSASVKSKDCPDGLTYKYNKDMDIKVTDKEYEILCKIVEAEAGDQDVYGRILVVNVILNRVNYKKEFPFDIEGVVFMKNQFSPITNGAYDRAKPDEITKEAVKRALQGEDYSDGALYFIQRSCASKSGAAYFDTLKFVLKYGCHEFYK